MKKLLYKQKDESWIDSDGNVIFFSCERFIIDICIDKKCFICGQSSKQKTFNDEHIIPNWILKKFNLHNQKITLPNTNTISYGQYRIPCCKDCNSWLGKTFEKPIRDLFSKGSTAIYRYLEANGPYLFSVWMCLIYLKIHLKDFTLSFHLDKRNGDEKISDLYNPSELHHIHCLVRSFHPDINITIEPNVHGSFVTLPAYDDGGTLFDYVNSFLSKSIMIRVDEIAFIQIIDDCGACLNKINPLIEKLKGPLVSPQLRELFVRISELKVLLKNNPKFYTQLNAKDIKILTKRDERPHFCERVVSDYIRMFNDFCGIYFDNLEKNSDIEKDIANGTLSFLFDNEGQFINYRNLN